MATNEELQAALLAIHSRLGVIEGKVNLVARADREQLLELLNGAVTKQPLIGQIYLLLDGRRSQKEIHEKLAEYGLTPSIMTVSRRMEEMETEYGIADLVTAGGAKVCRKDPEMEKVLNLSSNIRRWLDEAGATIPEAPARKRREKGL